MTSSRHRKKRPPQKRPALMRGDEHSGQQEQTAQQARMSAVLMRNRRVIVFIAVLFLIAIVLRITNLTAQSLWADEGNSVRVTERPFKLVIDAARADVHPPGYYVLLWLWAKLFGQGETAMRALSVVIGVALVGVVYVLGGRLFGARAGWLAAFCAAISPLQVVYSQEVRMYILVAFWAAVAALALARWLEAQDRTWRVRWSAVYAVSIAGGLWTHYSFPVVIAAINVAWLAWWIAQRKQAGWWAVLFWWGGAHLAALILYLPWLPTAWSKMFGYGAISESYSVPFIVGQSLKLLSVGETMPDNDWARWLTVAMVGLAIFGAWSGFAPGTSAKRRWSAINTLALVLLVVAPIAMTVGLTLAGRPAYRPKFFLVASPAFCLLTGAGIALLEQTSGPQRRMSNRLWLMVGLGLVVAGAIPSLRNYYTNPVYARSDYRGIARQIAQMQRDGDAVLLNAPNQWEVFTYYYPETPNHAPVYPLCRARPPVEAEVTAELQAITAKHQRLFVLYWAAEQSDPQRIVERWLEANTFKAVDVWYGDVRLAIYAVPQDLAAVKMEHPLQDVRLGKEIALRGYTVSPVEAQHGDIMQIALFWEALAIPQERYKVFVHLVDAQGQIVSQFDGEPGGGMNLTINWRPDQGVFPDRYGVLVPLTAVDGEYRLLVGLYEVSGAPRLPVSVDGQATGDVLTLATVQVR